MKKALLAFIILIIIFAGIIFYLSKKSEKEEISLIPSPPAPPKIEIESEKRMSLESPAFENNQYIPLKYTCDGEDINPPLEIKNVPEGTKSLVLILEDPDAPRGTFSHWLLWNIKPETSLIEENSYPQGAVLGLNDFGKNSYGGPCPPKGTHRYYFKLYALNTSIEIDQNSKKGDLEKAIKGKIIAKAELIGLYQRK